MSNGKGGKKKVTKKHKKNIKMCSDGKICSALMNTDDVPTKVSSLGCRVLFTLISCIFIGYNIQNGQSFFTSTFMFGLPLLFDYLRFEPRTLLRKIIKWIGFIFSFGEVIISGMGLGGIFILFTKNNDAFIMISEKFIILKGQVVAVRYLWYILLVSVGITTLDWVVYKRKLQSELMLNYEA